MYRATVTLFIILGLSLTLLVVEAGIGHDGLLCEIGFSVRSTADSCGS